MKRVLVTGATGFIGRQTLAPLIERDFEVHAVSRGDTEAASDPLLEDRRIQWHTGDLTLTEGIDDVVQRIAPTHLLHLAWEVEHGKFWHTERNLHWVEASSRLLRSFRRAGGQRVVAAGTCAEYDWTDGNLSEAATPLEPATLYGAAKLALYRLQTAHARQFELSAAWGRIFFLHGPYEDPRRLVSSVVSQLLAGRNAETSEGTQIRDFLHTADLGSAFAALLDSEVEGPVNLGSGDPTSIRSVVELLGAITGRSELLRIGAREAAPNDPPRLLADVERLRSEVGWAPRFSLREGLEATTSWWREHLS